MKPTLSAFVLAQFGHSAVMSLHNFSDDNKKWDEIIQNL